MFRGSWRFRRGMIGCHQVLKVEVNITEEVGKVRNLK
jgi:hypothetical protein